MNHRGHRGQEIGRGCARINTDRTLPFLIRENPRLSAVNFLRVLSGKSIFLSLAALLLLAPVIARGQDQAVRSEQRLRYEITLSLDFDARTYQGTENVHWVNRGDHAVSTIFFHLYPNMRPPDYVAPTQKNDAGQVIADEPRLEITDARSPYSA
ncbi:MAG TPA: hypothetical protein VE863_10780, partial [Pyrinomonadaceae bacterium]|nr:hypothetical protein [Pyrinomonadaceae bacterium]